MHNSQSTPADVRASERRVGRFMLGAFHSIVNLTTALWVLGATSVATPWFDEIATKAAISRSWPELFVLLGEIDAVHGSYYVALKALGLEDSSFAAMRMLSLLCVVGATTFVYATCMTVVDKSKMSERNKLLRAGLPAQIFAALPSVVWLSGEARPFAVATLFVAMAGFFFTKVVTSADSGWRNYLMLGASLFVGSLFEIYVIILVAPMTMIALTHGGVNRRVRATRVGLVCTAASVMILPLVLEAFSQRGQVSWNKVPISEALVTAATKEMFGRGVSGSAAKLMVMSLALLAVIFVGRALYSRWRMGSGTSMTSHTALLFAFPHAVILGLHLLTPAYHPRYMAFTAVFLAPVLAVGMILICTSINKRRVRMLSMAGTLLFIAASGALHFVPGGISVKERDLYAGIHEEVYDSSDIYYLAPDSRSYSYAYPGAPNDVLLPGAFAKSNQIFKQSGLGDAEAKLGRKSSYILPFKGAESEAKAKQLQEEAVVRGCRYSSARTYTRYRVASIDCRE